MEHIYYLLNTAYMLYRARASYVKEVKLKRCMVKDGAKKNVSEVIVRCGSIRNMVARALRILMVAHVIAVFGLLLVGCSTGGVTRQGSDEAATAHVRFTKPERVYLNEIDVTSGKWTPETDTPELHAKAKRLLEEYFLSELKSLAPTSKATGQEVSGLLVAVSTTEADVNNIKARALWGMPAYPPKLVVRVQIFDLTKSRTIPATLFTVSGNCYTYNPAIAGGIFFDDYFDKMSESIAQQTAEELRRLCQ